MKNLGFRPFEGAMSMKTFELTPFITNHHEFSGIDVNGMIYFQNVPTKFSSIPAQFKIKLKFIVFPSRILFYEHLVSKM